VGRNDGAALALIIGGIGGGILAYWRGHNDGYQKAKSEDIPYIQALENGNSRLQNQNDQLMAELLHERRSNAQLREELKKRDMVQPEVQKTA